MNRIKIAQLYADADAFAGKTVTVAGWVKSVRDMKNFGFVTLNDGSCFKDLQVVMDRSSLENYDEIAHQNVAAALVAEGTLKLTPDAPQPFELAAASIRVEGPSAPDYPLQKKRATVEFLRTQQHLRPRTNLFRAVFRIRSVAAGSIHRFFQDRGFIYVHTPIITASDCEGAGEMFRVTTIDPTCPPLVSAEAASASEGALVAGEVDWSADFFGKPTSLTVSGQLNAENFAMAFGDVYTFGPTFRAENSNTARHAAEFWMVEPEIAFADLEDNMELAEAMLKYVITDVMERCPDELAMLNKFVDKGLIERLTHVAASDFARVTYTEAVDILLAAQDSGRAFEYPVEWGIDLQTEHERYLTEEHFGCPTFVTDYPAAIKAFYMRLNDDGRTVAAMDCLVPGIGEIVGGSQREERLEVLEHRIAELDMEVEEYRAYLDLRRFGTCSHAGFGLGFERLVMYLTGVSNIRDVIPHPRTVGNAEF
ncbi:asparagine--tRNA ligase [Adlercreutzia caecimuris]|uniref:asparagine--tRNA ligase n=1 Tax=Adlercreutzia caecimuris TaxID=671266 RepID=UPI001C3D3950|nr:asparagine--tRNA ligase [Adlercreutzia caecimuris]MCR2037784.1 asparagine--tRNA ligase [Adlercreutzia caecimuris]